MFFNDLVDNNGEEKKYLHDWTFLKIHGFVP